VLTKFARRVILCRLLLMLSKREGRQTEGFKLVRRVVLIIDPIYWHIMTLLEECCASLRLLRMIGTLAYNLLQLICCGKAYETEN
jgi:hypothetical protein